MFAKRLLIGLYDAASALAVAALFSLAWTQPAYAYIDPSVMTYTIQAVAGVAVALSAVAGVALRRGRKFLYNILDIDENARREVEPQITRLTTESALSPEAARSFTAVSESLPEVQTPNASAAAPTPVSASVVLPEGTEGAEGAGVPDETLRAQTSKNTEEQRSARAEAEAEGEPAERGASSGTPAPSAPSVPSGSQKRRIFDQRPYKPTWKERLAYGALASAFLFFTVFIVAPYEVIAGGAGSLVFSLADVWWVMVPPVLGAIAILTLVFVLLRGKAFSVALALVGALALCAYLQALVLNYSLPPADGSTIMWADYMAMQVVSTMVWVFVLVAAVGLSQLNRKRAQGVVGVVATFLIAVQLVGVASLFVRVPAGSDADGAGMVAPTEVVMTEDQLYTVNPNHNVIVFVLDTYDTAYLSRNLGMNPNLLDGLTGFTNYENCTGGMIPTRFAIPQMLTGQMMREDEEFSTYKAERYARSDFLQQIYDADYSIGLYSDSLTIAHLSDAEQYGITSKTVNMHGLPSSTMSYEGSLEAMWFMAMYRDVPWPLKWAFWYYTDQINALMAKYDSTASPDETIYVMNDIRYYNRLCDIRLSLEDGDYAGGFRFIHLLGAHYPFSYDEEVNDLGTDNSNVFKQSQGAIRIVQEYCDQLKELGVYDQTTIIVTADHGYWTLTMDPIEETSTPIMFVKPAQSAELDAQPIKVDEKPVSHFDLQPTVLDAMGLDYSEYTDRAEYEGYSMFRDIDPDRVRLYVTTDSEGLQEMQFREYVIDGNALDFDNWSETGRTWDALK